MSLGTRIGYAMTMVVSLGVAWYLLHRNQRSLGLTSQERIALGLAAFIGSMIGAKLPFVAEGGWNGIWSGQVWLMDGKTILGGIFGGYLAIEVTKFAMGIRTRTGDSFAIPVALAVAIGRVACFLGGCCFGGITTLPWGCTFPLANDPPGVLRHPTQLYEVFFHTMAVIALCVAKHRHWMVGNQLKGYLMAYLVYRFVSEWIRPESPWILGLTTYQIASVLLFSALACLWIVQSKTE